MYHASFVSLLCFLHLISAQLPFQDFLRSIPLQQPAGHCIATKQIGGCNVSLAESYIPKSPNVANIVPTTLVYLFTPRSPNVAEPLHECGGRLPPGTTYDPEADTEVFIHGWLDGVCRTFWMRESKDQLFKRARRIRKSYNVILVDWTWGSFEEYYLASQNCKIAGEQVGFVLNNIMFQMGISPEKFHMIGHSFGAIASGFTGRMVPGLRRITALDPAVEPAIREPPDQRVTYRDARIVDVIHSNAGTTFPFFIGDIRQLGHADFYPNGGTVQLGCISYAKISVLKGDFLWALISVDPPFCSHLHAVQYYKYSIYECQYLAATSTSYLDFLKGNYGNERAIMGMDYEDSRRNDTQRRIYYLKTTNKIPYCNN